MAGKVTYKCGCCGQVVEIPDIAKEETPNDRP